MHNVSFVDDHTLINGEIEETVESLKVVESLMTMYDIGLDVTKTVHARRSDHPLAGPLLL